MSRRSAPKLFTGRHMTLILIAFFGVVIAVNMTMAVFATRTFGGKVVENSYVASQRFNGWLEQARAQERLGWEAGVSLEAGRRPELAIGAPDGPLTGAEVVAVARHPLGRAEDIPLRFIETSGGRYVADTRLPAGRWQLHLRIRRGPDEARLIETVL